VLGVQRTTINLLERTLQNEFKSAGGAFPFWMSGASVQSPAIVTSEQSDAMSIKPLR
jgi:hypothetical protein